MRLGRLGAALALFTIIPAGCSHSSSTRDGRTDGAERVSATSQAIQGGTDDGTAHPFAVGVCGGNNPGECNSICSGTLITPNLVVTARHCVDASPHVIDCAANPQFGGRHAAMFITTNNKIFQGSSALRHSVDVSTIVTPADDHICGHDIALLILDDLVDAAEAKPAIPGIQYPMGDINRYVHRYTAVGYGNTGPEPNGAGAGTRRIRASIPILCIPGDDFIPCPKEVDDKEFYAGDGTCSGDSGSGAYEDHSFQKNAPVTFGVLSRGGDNADPDAGTAATLCKGGLYTRLDRYRDLVLQAAETASANWTKYPKPVPDWTVYVPPPPDAGVPEAGPPKPPRVLDDGFACDMDSQCKSKLCADTGAGKACTERCDEAVVPTTCAEGFICKAAVCVQNLGEPAAPAAAESTTTTTEGCSVSSPRHPGGLPFGMLGLASATLFGLGLRRRTRTRGAARIGR